MEVLLVSAAVPDAGDPAEGVDEQCQDDDAPNGHQVLKGPDDGRGEACIGGPGGERVDGVCVRELVHDSSVAPGVVVHAPPTPGCRLSQGLRRDGAGAGADNILIQYYSGYAQTLPDIRLKYIYRFVGSSKPSHKGHPEHGSYPRRNGDVQCC